MDSKFFASGKYEEDLTEVSLCYSLWLEMFTTQSIADVEWLANSASVSRIRDENSSSYSISSVSVTFSNFLLLWASAPPKHYPPSHYPTPLHFQNARENPAWTRPLGMRSSRKGANCSLGETTRKISSFTILPFSIIPHWHKLFL